MREFLSTIDVLSNALQVYTLRIASFVNNSAYIIHLYSYIWKLRYFDISLKLNYYYLIPNINYIIEIYKYEYICSLINLAKV